MTKENLYTIEQYEQAKLETRRAPEHLKKAYQSREFKVWVGAFSDVTPERASPLPPTPIKGD